MNEYDFCVFLGRMRPPHAGHMANINAALTHGKFAIIIVGSLDIRTDERNPFTFDEVRKMIIESVEPIDRDRLIVIGVHDVGNTPLWIAEVERKVSAITKAAKIDNPTVALITHLKDGTSEYQNSFYDWDKIEVPNHNGLSATTIRIALFEEYDPMGWVRKNADILPLGTYHYLHQEWINGNEFNRIRAEYHFMKTYNQTFESEGSRKYGIKAKHYTADTVVIFGGKIALIQRKSKPGLDAWALPGGHVEDDETAEQAALRELSEEVGIDVSAHILRKSIVASKVFDNPFRSTRGRTITNAFLIVIEPVIRGTNPKKIKKDLAPPKLWAKSDAKEAIWVPLGEVLDNWRPKMFEDHFNIIQWAASVINERGI